MSRQIRILALETTRRCNARCSHCMRGNAQNVDMSITTLYNLGFVLRKLKAKQHTLLFSGGEPSLAAPVISNAFDILSPFWEYTTVTNGVRYTKEFMAVLKRINDTTNNGMLVNISTDDYHKPFNNETEIKKLKQFCRNNRIMCLEKNKLHRIVLSGRSKKEKIGRVPGYQDFIKNGMLYIAVNGDILQEPEGEYHKYKNYRMANVNNVENAVNFLSFALPDENVKFVED